MLKDVGGVTEITPWGGRGGEYSATEEWDVQNDEMFNIKAYKLFSVVPLQKCSLSRPIEQIDMFDFSWFSRV